VQDAKRKLIHGSSETFLYHPSTMDRTMNVMDVRTLSSTSDPPTKKRGFILVITMMMLVIITTSVFMLWNNVTLGVMIAGNNRRAMHAKHSAISGINHFMAMKFYDEDVYAMLGEAERATLIDLIQIPRSKQYYKVEVSTCCNRDGNNLTGGKFRVISTGYYGNKPSEMSTSVIEAMIQTR